MDYPLPQLAIRGGSPVFPDGPPGWPPDDDEVELALQTAVQQNSWGTYHGPWTDALRRTLTEMFQLEFVRLCASGTVAVELALKGVGVGRGEEVILAAYDFPGNFRCVEHIGAHPVLVDVSLQHLAPDVDMLEAAFSDKTAAVLVSHLHSGLAPMQRLCRCAEQRGVPVVEDCCQSPAAIVDGRLAGKWGRVATLSFGGSKLLSAGRGGAVLTSDAACFQRMKVYSERGNDAYPLSELQAAVLGPQLDKLADRNRVRQQQSLRLRQAVEDIRSLSWCGDRVVDDNRPSFYKVCWRLNDTSSDRNAWIAALQAEGVAIDEGFRGFTRRSHRRCRRVGDLTEAALTASHSLLLHHPILLESDETIDRLAFALRKVAGGLQAQSSSGHMDVR